MYVMYVCNVCMYVRMQSNAMKCNVMYVYMSMYMGDWQVLLSSVDLGNPRVASSTSLVAAPRRHPAPRDGLGHRHIM